LKPTLDDQSEALAKRLSTKYKIPIFASIGVGQNSSLLELERILRQKMNAFLGLGGPDVQDQIGR
jgi:hypothetical protein